MTSIQTPDQTREAWIRAKTNTPASDRAETYTATAGEMRTTGTLHECVCWADSMMMQGADEVTIRREG